MRGFHAAFPKGAAGTGLILLRSSILLHFYTYSGTVSLDLWLGFLWGATAFLVASGFLTPITVIACFACNLTAFYLTAHHDVTWLISASLSAAAMGLLGPGAYSLDAKIFGRRQLYMDGYPTK